MADKETAPATETKADKFKRLAEARTEKALTAIAQLRGLSSKNNYDYTEEQVGKILKALEAEVITVQEAFAGKVAAKGGFSL